jgi:hypothetical protein
MSTSEAPTRHTCTPDGRPLPFGRKDKSGQCPRCNELLAGAAPRGGWQQDYFASKKKADEDRTAAIKAHTNDNCPYMTKTPSGFYTGVCVCFDW